MSTFVNLLEVIYPVGSYYITTSSTSPSASFGGTWSCVNNSFYPETLRSDASAASLSDDFEWSYKVKRNGINFISAASYTQISLPRNKYYDVYTYTSSDKPMIEGAATVNAIMGNMSDFAALLNNNGALKVGTKANPTDYWMVSVSYPISISGVKSYIWKRTA